MQNMWLQWTDSIKFEIFYCYDPERIIIDYQGVNFIEGASKCTQAIITNKNMKTKQIR